MIGSRQSRFLNISRAGGVTLIELIVFIVIVSVGLVGVLSAFNLTTAKSADPILRKQALAVAESMLEEVMTKDYQNDATDPGNTSNTVGCTANTPTTCRKNTVADRANYNDVDDYDTWNQTVFQPDGTPVAALSAYNVKVSVAAPAPLNGATAKMVTVTVTGGSESVQLIGYRTYYD